MTVEHIVHLAQQFAQAQKQWHFHILTPDCMLNTKKQYALILENVTDQQVHAVYADQPYMGVGQTLVQLLHGNDVLRDRGDELSVPPSPQVSKLLKRAQELSLQGLFWHHHMLFPGCQFNKHSDKWVIIFEDPATQELIESISEQEPKGDLQHIEALFYAQTAGH